MNGSLLRKMLFLGYLCCICIPLTRCCSIYCPDETRLCVNDLWYTRLGGQCAGFIGCKEETEPCTGRCPQTHPVLSINQRYCETCDYEDKVVNEECLSCSNGRYSTRIWCAGEQKCISTTSTCNGKCLLETFPLKIISIELHLNSTAPPFEKCTGCPGETFWCAEEQRCYNPYEEGCNKECADYSQNYCPLNNKCLDDSTPCGKSCSHVEYGEMRYCENLNLCIDANEKHDENATKCTDQCDYHQNWCEEENKCFDPKTEACNEACAYQSL